ncbi:hypothetical protein EDD17DRAFT_261679 [Pisolithus thermaeus]|nr:hypothetical protein EDD17DRAFT_261679 [Pisolithus thermaeus]
MTETTSSITGEPTAGEIMGSVLTNDIGYADVVPLQISGTIDTEMSMITAREMLSWGLRNLWENGREGAYAVRHGNQPVSDFGRPQRSAGEDCSGDHCKRDVFLRKSIPVPVSIWRGRH